MDAHVQKTQQQESRATADRRGSILLSEQQGSKCTNQSCWKKKTYHSRASCFIRSHMTSPPHRLKQTSSMQSKRRDLHHTWLHRETNEELNFCCYSPRWITTTFLICVIHNRTIGGLTPPDRYRIFNTTVSFQSFHSFEAALRFTAKLKIEINVNVILEFEVFIRHCFTGHSFYYN